MTAVKFDSMHFVQAVPGATMEGTGDEPRSPFHRARAVPATGMPTDRRSRRRWTAVSIAIHVLLILWLTRPEGFDKVNPNLVLAPPVGGGGEGPLGGGGGGTRGTGAVRYVPLVVPPRPSIVPP